MTLTDGFKKRLDNRQPNRMFFDEINERRGYRVADLAIPRCAFPVYVFLSVNSLPNLFTEAL